MIKHLKPLLLRGVTERPEPRGPLLRCLCSVWAPSQSPAHRATDYTWTHRAGLNNNQQHLVVRCKENKEMRWPTDGLLGSFFLKGFLYVNN